MVTCTIPPVREIVIVIADLYLDPEPDDSGREASAPAIAHRLAIPHLARFGDRALLPQGWRSWAAQWLGVPQYAGQLPASVAAASLTSSLADRAVWLATPLHLIAGLTSVHFDRRSLLRLPRAEVDELAASFAQAFRGSGFELHALPGSDLLLSGPPATPRSATTEPARMMLTSVAAALPAGAGAPAMRRLGSELEMWLHGHPLNAQRAQRGEPGIATLWVWGGGAPPISASAAARDPGAAAFGSDAYLRGLWRLAGGEAQPMPVDWTAVIGESRAARSLAVVEVAELLHDHASWRLADAVAEIDRAVVSPSLAALHRGDLDRLVLVANDRRLTITAAHRWRLWRRARRSRPGLEGLM